MKEFNVSVTQYTIHRQQSIGLAFIMMKCGKTLKNHFLHITCQYVGFCVVVCVEEVGWVE